ncbi:hypothetical protein Tco_1070960 [Tanacetum coccineum]|uniref:Zonadhesin n=1 Tax=Tanacetum coccineum TaxID=301880 RepID=A0ABQ5HQ20_9ASTR
MEMLSDVAMLEADTRKAMKASLRDLRSKHQTGGLSEGASITPEVPDESQAKSTDTNKGAGITPEVPDVYKAASMIQDLESEEDDVIFTSEDERSKSEKETTKSGKNDDDMSIDLNETNDEEDEHVDDETQSDEYVHEDEYVHKDDEYVHEEEEHVHDYVEEELNDEEIAKTIEGAELTDPNKAEVEKTEEVKGTLVSATQKEKPDLPPTSSNVSISSGFVIPEPIVLTPIPEIVTKAPATTISPLIPILTSFTSAIQQSTPIPTPKTTEAPSSTTVLLVFETLSAIHPTSAGSSKGTTQSQPKPTSKSVQAEETVLEPEGTDMPLKQGDDTGKTDEQPDVEAITMDDWFIKPTRPPTPDPEWNKCKSVDDGPKQSWLNDLVNAEKPPRTFIDLISTIIDFFAFAINCLKTSKLTKADLVGPIYNVLKGTCKSCVELEYNIEECRLTVPVDFFFNNDLEYLRGGSTNRKYTTSITKIKAAKYELEGIEDMVPKL